MYRKILLVLGLLFSFSLFSMASRLEPYSSSRIFWDTASRSIIFQSGGYARVIQLKDHRLMAVAENNGINIAFSNNMYGAQNEAYKMMEGRKVGKVVSLQRVMRGLMVEAPQNETFTLV